MDRFIACECCFIYFACSNLKSNMDRFIDNVYLNQLLYICHLKSNMDRFIDLVRDDMWVNDFNLKSNMDRFIAEI